MKHLIRFANKAHSGADLRENRPFDVAKPSDKTAALAQCAMTLRHFDAVRCFSYLRERLTHAHSLIMSLFKRLMDIVDGAFYRRENCVVLVTGQHAPRRSQSCRSTGASSDALLTAPYR